MSGHSKWNNIKRKKEKTDSQKAKIFTKIGREMAVAIKEGGSSDPASNSKLKELIAKAKANNVPNDNIERIIKKASSEDKADYESVVYEGYGPCGVAVIVETLTDNRNRTAGDVRHYFDKFGGNLGTTGCVSFMFTEKGIIVVDPDGVDEEKAMEDFMEAGADDFNFDEDAIEIVTAPADVTTVATEIEKMGYKVISAEAEMVPSTYTSIDDPDISVKMGRLLEMLEDNDDVQNVWHNWESPQE